MSQPCTSKNTLRFLTLVKQKFDRLLFASFAMEPIQSLVLKSSGLRSIVFCCAAPKGLYKFSLVKMLTLDVFGRPSETISVTP